MIQHVASVKLCDQNKENAKSQKYVNSWLQFSFYLKYRSFYLRIQKHFENHMKLLI